MLNTQHLTARAVARFNLVPDKILNFAGFPNQRIENFGFEDTLGGL